MRARSRNCLFWGAVASGSIALACSASSSSNSYGGASGSGDHRDAGDSSLDTTTPIDNSDSNFIIPETGPTEGSTDDDAESCSADTAEATRIPLDIVILLDVSGSMLNADKSKVTKFEAVRTALTKFLDDPKSADLGIGFQYFPANKPGVPNACTQPSQCGSGGPCTAGVCLDSVVKVPYDENSDSYPNDQWVECSGPWDCDMITTGECHGIGLTAEGFVCLIGYHAGCFPLEKDFCMEQTSCEPSRYKDLAVGIQPISNARTAVKDSMAQNEPFDISGTPTHPALTGAVQAAREYLGSNPTHTSVVLLATDGLPTACDITDIDQVADVAKQAAAGSPPVKTFVIGIFTKDDMLDGEGKPVDPQGNLDKIASSGGTEKATVISASETDVTTQFLAELEKMRGSYLACDYNIPDPGPNKTLDYQKVNVNYTSDGKQTTLGYVASADQCKDASGWYYDVAPDKGTPKKIQVCPATCKEIKADNTAQISFSLGCKTKGPA